MNKQIRMSCLSLLTAAALGGLGSCSNDDLLDGANLNKLPENAISFNVTQKGALSRGTETNGTNFEQQIENFQVWGYFDKTATGTGVIGGGLYVGDNATEGTVINGNGAGVWSYAIPEKQQYWPATTAPLNFQAITPSSHSSFTIKSTTPAATSQLPNLVASVTVPTVVTDQQDIMFAQTNGVTRETNAQTVALNFEHAMSQVVFSGRVASNKIEAEVHSIELHNIHNTADVGYMGEQAALTTTLTGQAAETYNVGVVAGAKMTDPATAVNLTASDGALFMLPQTVAKWTTTPQAPVPTTQADASHNSYLKVTCTVKDKASNVVLLNNEAVYIPFEVNWQQGKKYTYTLAFGQGEQGFNQDGAHDNRLLQIKYSVNASEWNAADGGELGVGGQYNGPKKLTYTPSVNVKITNNIEYFSSIKDAKGKELLPTDRTTGELFADLSNSGENVYVVLKDDNTTLKNVFLNCTALTSIPADLFAACPNVTTVSYAFSSCTALERIPADLFKKNNSILHFNNSFSNCTALTGLPHTLFAHNPKAEMFVNTFKGCTSLKSIPASLFAHNPNVTDFGSTFFDCTSLQSIPVSLFDNNKKVNNFNNVFYRCTALTGETPYTLIKDVKVKLWERSTIDGFTVPNSSFGAFSDCTGLSDYEKIPNNWKGL